VTAQPTSFIDISDSDYKTDIEKAKTVGLIDGTSDTTFTPQGLLTREQTAKLLYTIVEKIDGATLGNETPEFLDSDQISDWAVPYVAFVQKNNIMQGSNGNFNPQGNLTCEQAMVVMERLIVQFGWIPWYGVRGPLPDTIPVHPNGKKCLGIIEVDKEDGNMSMPYFESSYHKKLQIGDQFYYYGFTPGVGYDVIDNGKRATCPSTCTKVIKTF
jgi:hypothetical protein